MEAHTVLIVEDDPLVRHALAERFEEAGWLVFQSASAEKALVLVGSRSPEVVFTDIQLEGCLSGWDLGKACCERGVPVIYTSGQAAPDGKMRAGGVFFAKPYDLDAVIAACAKLCP
jgi:DNA-binding NtrC family response regulator